MSHRLRAWEDGEGGPAARPHLLLDVAFSVHRELQAEDGEVVVGGQEMRFLVRKRWVCDQVLLMREGRRFLCSCKYFCSACTCHGRCCPPSRHASVRPRFPAGSVPTSVAVSTEGRTPPLVEQQLPGRQL